MKNHVCCFLAVLLILSLCVPVFADNGINGSDTGSMTVSVMVEPTYTVTIPADTAIPFNALSTSIGEIGVSHVRIHPDKQITVTANASGALANSLDALSTIPYTLCSGGSTFRSAAFRTDGQKALTVDISQSAWDAAAAGSYSDTITFTVSYDSIP